MSLVFARRLTRPAGHGPAPSRPVCSLFVLQKWLSRHRQRKALRDLAEQDQHLLRDIGLSRAEALREAAKPFWRP